MNNDIYESVRKCITKKVNKICSYVIVANNIIIGHYLYIITYISGCE